MSAPPATSPARALLDDALGSLGKVVAVVAGAGLFLYLIGTAVLWQRVDDIGLQAQEVVAAIPRDQLAVAGARETLLSLVSGVFFAYFLYACYGVYRASQRVVATDGVRGRLARWMRERPALVITATVAVAGTPVTPMGAGNALFGLAFLVNLYLGVRSAHRSLIGELPDFRSSLRPWLRVVAGWSIAVFIVSVWRPSEFREPFALADVQLVREDTAKAAVDLEHLCGRYIGSTPDAVIFAESCSDATTATTDRALIVSRDKIARMTLTATSSKDPTQSLLSKVGVPLDCIPPLCQWKAKRLSLLHPFDAN